MEIKKTKKGLALSERSESKGFTFVELAISLAIFGSIVLTTTAITLSVVQAQRIAFAVQNIQETGRYVLETMTRELRTSTVNSLSADQTTLNITSYGETLDYRFDNVNGRVLRDEELITPIDVEVLGSFYLRQYSNPERSVVTIVMKIINDGAKIEEQREIYLQSTISTR
ncbi:PilW family protein [Patescibacteria group bacterium]